VFSRCRLPWPTPAPLIRAHPPSVSRSYVCAVRPVDWEPGVSCETTAVRRSECWGSWRSSKLRDPCAQQTASVGARTNSCSWHSESNSFMQSTHRPDHHLCWGGLAHAPLGAGCLLPNPPCPPLYTIPLQMG